MVEKEGTRKKCEPFKRMTKSRADIFDWVPSNGEESYKTEKRKKMKKRIL